MQKPQITDVPPRAAKYYQKTPHTTVPPVMQSPLQPARNRFIFPFAVGMFCLIGVVLLWTLVVSPFITRIENQWHYGDAQTAELTANVGHGGVSHLYAFMVNGQIVVVEVRAYPPAHVYMSPSLFGSPQDNRIVTITTEDVNHDGKLDLVLHVQGMEITPVLFNTGDSFQWTSP